MVLNRVTQLALLLASLAFIAVGLQGLFTPAAFFRRFGLALVDPSSFSELRTAYGGFFLACAALFACAAFRETLRDVALWLVAMIHAGFIVGRVTSLVLDGVPNTLSLVLTGAEAGALVVAVVLIVLRKCA